MNDTMEKELLPADQPHVITNSSLIKVGERYYEIKPLIPLDFKVDTMELKEFKLENGLNLDKDIAYINGDYYYFYRGKLSEQRKLDPLKPGIYYDDDQCKYVFCTPETDEEKEEYRYGDKITSLDADAIRDAVMSKKVVILNTPDIIHSTIPPESMEDDILKRIVKRAFQEKHLNVDDCRTRFISKNTLFNFKSVLRGDSRLSMLLFDRGMEALNLKYTIIVDEAGGDIIGRPLDKSIVISSGDVYQSFVDASSNDEDEFETEG